MADSRELQLILKVIDDASAELKKISDNTKKAMDGVTESQNAAKESNDNLAQSVFSGVAAWDLLKTGVEKTAQFFLSSAQAALEQERNIGLLNATLRSMGANTPAVNAQLEKFGQTMLGRGYDADGAELAAAKLAKTAGGDVVKGMQLAK